MKLLADRAPASPMPRPFPEPALQKPRGHAGGHPLTLGDPRYKDGDTQPILVLIPARNEGHTVAEVVQDAREALDLQVVVIDDQSTDDTAAAAQSAGATVLRLRQRLGAWGAIQTGFRYAIKHGYRLVVTMDADGQHQAEFISALLAPVLSHRADVVIGAHPERGSRARHAAWSAFRIVSGLWIRDLTSGFRAYNREAVRLLASDRASLLEYQDLGVLLLLRHAGLRIVETPTPMKPRMSGHSQVFSSWAKVAVYLLHTGILCSIKRAMPPITRR
jgi:glycosyltransferase involved in cell wall biosynthesis